MTGKKDSNADLNARARGVETSREAVERVAALTWERGEPGSVLEEAAALLRALLAERDHLREECAGVVAERDDSEARFQKALAERDAARAEVERLREALVRLRDCDWVITPLDRMDAVRDIARAALEPPRD